jgi:hypothetical protein
MASQFEDITNEISRVCDEKDFENAIRQIAEMKEEEEKEEAEAEAAEIIRNAIRQIADMKAVEDEEVKEAIRKFAEMEVQKKKNCVSCTLHHCN